MTQFYLYPFELVKDCSRECCIKLREASPQTWEVYFAHDMEGQLDVCQECRRDLVKDCQYRSNLKIVVVGDIVNVNVQKMHIPRYIKAGSCARTRIC